MDNPCNVWILDEYSQNIVGILRVIAYVCDKKGSTNYSRSIESSLLTFPKSKIEEDVYIMIFIESANLQPFVKNPYIKYHFKGRNFKT